MRFYEQISNHKYPEQCVLIHDIPEIQIKYFKEYVAKHPFDNQAQMSPPMDIDGDETYSDIVGGEPENTIIQLIMDKDLNGLVPCFLERNKRLYYQHFNNFTEQDIEMVSPELSDSYGNNNFATYLENKIFINPQFRLPRWNPDGVVITIRWCPTTAWGQPDAEYRIHDVGVKTCTNWENSIKLALFLEQFKWLKAF